MTINQQRKKGSFSPIGIEYVETNRINFSSSNSLLCGDDKEEWEEEGHIAGP
jgi:hypothetical protein